jgi:hypothetical protein
MAYRVASRPFPMSHEMISAGRKWVQIVMSGWSRSRA